ncbi:hypothetical protein [Acinetobacter variabilis]|uniref:Uncharacterized protein n=1 Tax=Acinetobacter variabilis TaxID=70346 RepID=N8WT64_9GAMM|nr:hypothetical protein [Acinetobacter variabilis]ENU98472.1 hypothetical protein F969_02503 [Acinetobacter variabilis]
MLKLVSNKDGVEVHQLTIADNEISITPAFDGITELLSGITDKQQILSALSQFNSEYVWAVTYETPLTPALTRRQFRLALVTNGYNLADIETLITQIEDDMQRQIIQIEWQDATVFERNNSSLLKMAAIMGLSSAQIDELWSQALTL